MATVRSCFEPGANDPRLWAHNTSATSVTGWSAPTTSTGAVAPSHARRWLKATDAGSVNIAICRGASITQATYGYYIQRDLLIEGTIPAGYNAIYVQGTTSGGSAWGIRVIRGTTSSKYQLRVSYGTSLATTLFTSSSEFDTGTKYSIRLQIDGTNWTLWVNGTQEGQGARTAVFNSRGVTASPPTASSGVEHYWATGMMYDTSTESERPDHTTVETRDLEVDTGGSESEAGWGDDGDCTAGATTAAIADVAMNGSDQVDTSTYWCEHASETDAETVDTVTYTFTVSDSMGGGCHRSVWAANVGSKTVTAAARIYNGSAGVNVTLAGLGSTTFFSRHNYFENAPDSGAWTQSKVDSLKVGGINQGSGANGANTQLACIIFTLGAVEFDPPAAGATPYATVDVL